MQAQGYTIIAVEQTVNSQNLYEFQFPEKTLLLLGYEKLLLLFVGQLIWIFCLEMSEKVSEQIFYL